MCTCWGCFCLVCLSSTKRRRYIFSTDSDIVVSVTLSSTLRVTTYLEPLHFKDFSEQKQRCHVCTMLRQKKTFDKVFHSRGWVD